MTGTTWSSTPLALECRGLTYRFGSQTAVDGIDLCVRPGEVFGLLGANGAGKTTTIRVVTTLLSVEPGRVRVFGLELAQAMVNTPRLLVLDEPTVGLDPIARSDVWEHLRSLQARPPGMTVLLTTHYMDEADALCDTVALMHRGRIRRVGTPADLKAALGPGATLDDVFRRYAGDQEGEIRDLNTGQRTASG